MVTALAIWFVHFMLCWVASEIWSRQRTGHVLAWGATAIALLAVGAHFMRVKAQYADGHLSAWHYRFAQRAVAIAAVAVLFSAVPAVVLLP